MPPHSPSLGRHRPRPAPPSMSQRAVGMQRPAEAPESPDHQRLSDKPSPHGPQHEPPGQLITTRLESPVSRFSYSPQPPLHRRRGYPESERRHIAEEGSRRWTVDGKANCGKHAATIKLSCGTRRRNPSGSFSTEGEGVRARASQHTERTPPAAVQAVESF